MAEINQPKKDFRHIVRIADTDLDGSKQLFSAIRKINGVSFMISHAVCIASGIDMKRITGEMTVDEVRKIEDVLNDPLKYGLPTWLLNRRKDVETGKDMHNIGTDLKVAIDNDIKLMKKIRCYKGVRHMIGQPVRGQSTKSNFRNKRNKKSTLGVQRKKAGAPAAPAAKSADKKGKK